MSFQGSFSTAVPFFIRAHSSTHPVILVPSHHRLNPPPHCPVVAKPDQSPNDSFKAHLRWHYPLQAWQPIISPPNPKKLSMLSQGAHRLGWNPWKRRIGSRSVGNGVECRSTSVVRTTVLQNSQRMGADFVAKRNENEEQEYQGQSLQGSARHLSDDDAQSGNAYKERRSFRQLYGNNENFPEWLLSSLETLGFHHPTQVQRQTFSVLFPENSKTSPNGCSVVDPNHTIHMKHFQQIPDIIVHAQTGSGKTLAYLVPALAAVDPERACVQALVIVPTQELGVQVYKLAKKIVQGYQSASTLNGADDNDDLGDGRNSDTHIDDNEDECEDQSSGTGIGAGARSAGFPVLAALDQGDINRQKIQLRNVAPRLIIGTPTRIIELALKAKKRLRLDLIKVLVVDEFDACWMDDDLTQLLHNLLSGEGLPTKDSLYANGYVDPTLLIDPVRKRGKGGAGRKLGVRDFDLSGISVLTADDEDDQDSGDDQLHFQNNSTPSQSDLQIQNTYMYDPSLSLNPSDLRYRQRLEEIDSQEEPLSLAVSASSARSESRSFLKADTKASSAEKTSTRLTILASATVPQHKYFMKFCIAQRWTRENVQHLYISNDEKLPATLSHFYAICGAKKKIAALRLLLQSVQPRAALVFFHEKRPIKNMADILNEALTQIDPNNELTVASIHPGDSVSHRKNNVNDFRDGKLKVLLSTDLAARGLDFEHISHVFNFDLPKNADWYLHRAGRAGRMGRKGTVITLLSPGEEFVLERIANTYNINMEKYKLKKR